ncbi:MAG: hypothetical protein LBB72_01535 [Spirochaetaceae bacterium]|jgi:hypothetical protein|nr:hypothetical protein [Spirochaetaceae bacterium]
MKITITMQNPHDSMKPTRLTSSDCETLDDAAGLVFFFMKTCRIITVSVEGK